jgi:hypothetical protein
MPTVVMQELCIFLLSDRSLDLVNCLFDEDAILDVENSICVTLELWVVSDHDTCCPN